MIKCVLIFLIVLLVTPAFAGTSTQPAGAPLPYYPAIWVNSIYQSDGIETNGKTYVPLSVVLDAFHATISAKVVDGKNVINLNTPPVAGSLKTPPVPAIHFESGAMVLKGLKSIAVEVDPVNLDLQNGDITPAQLKSQCMAKLRGAGINAVDFDDLTKAPRPVGDLILTVSAAKVTDWPVYSYYVNLHLERLSASVDDPSMRYLTTVWQSITPTQDTQDLTFVDVQTAIDDTTSKFLEDFVKANPK